MLQPQPGAALPAIQPDTRFEMDDGHLANVEIDVLNSHPKTLADATAQTKKETYEKSVPAISG
jgi:hypothetical protein